MQPIPQTNPFDDPYSERQDPNAILNNCREVGRAIDELEGRLTELQRVQRQFVAGTTTTNKEIDAIGADIMATYRALGERVKRIKSQPGKSPCIHPSLPDAAPFF